MLAKLRSKLTYANVMVTLPAFVVLGGGAYALQATPSTASTTKQLDGTPPPGRGSPLKFAPAQPAFGITAGRCFHFFTPAVNRNKRNGTATLTVITAVAMHEGELHLRKTQKVKPDETASPPFQTLAKLSIKPRGEAKRKLNNEGEAKVKAKVVYRTDRPGPGDPRCRKDRKIKLVKR